MVIRILNFTGLSLDIQSKEGTSDSISANTEIGIVEHMYHMEQVHHHGEYGQNTKF